MYVDGVDITWKRMNHQGLSRSKFVYATFSKAGWLVGWLANASGNFLKRFNCLYIQRKMKYESALREIRAD